MDELEHQERVDATFEKLIAANSDLTAECEALKAQLAAANEALYNEVTAASDFGNTLFRLAQGRETVDAKDIARLLRAHGRVEQADKLEANDER